jgi:hypothetical protein
MQDDHPLAFYNRKLNSTQKWYTNGKQELVSIVETLKEFKNILLAQKLKVHTDHKNLLHQKVLYGEVTIKCRVVTQNCSLVLASFYPNLLCLSCHSLYNFSNYVALL